LPWLVWQERRLPTSQTLILAKRATFVRPRGRTQTRTVTLDRDTVTGRDSGFFREIRVFSLYFTGVPGREDSPKFSEMCVVVQPSARETFTPCELIAAYKQFTGLGPQYVSAESGIGAAAYQFGERVLLVYEESETGLVVLIHPSA
jgi:hypothetical protein